MSCRSRRQSVPGRGSGALRCHRAAEIRTGSAVHNCPSATPSRDFRLSLQLREPGERTLALRLCTPLAAAVPGRASGGGCSRPTAAGSRRARATSRADCCCCCRGSRRRSSPTGGSPTSPAAAPWSTTCGCRRSRSRALPGSWPDSAGTRTVSGRWCISGWRGGTPAGCRPHAQLHSVAHSGFGQGVLESLLACGGVGRRRPSPRRPLSSACRRTCGGCCCGDAGSASCWTSSAQMSTSGPARPPVLWSRSVSTSRPAIHLHPRRQRQSRHRPRRWRHLRRRRVASTWVSGCRQT